MADGKVVFQIDGDARGVKNTIKDVTADIEKESKKWDNAVKDSSDDMTKSFAKAFDIERLKNWGIQAAKAIGKFIGEAISAASDLAEVQNVVDVTFGDSAKKIDSWAQSAGNNFGLTETQAKRYASTIGAMLKSQGVAQNEVLDMSESLAGLAADMASFYNLDFDTAFEKIRSGISGETMPLKQLGINMSVANLNAFALAQGLEKTFDQMSQGEQTMLRYQYIMQATADAQGDFEKTSDGFANAQRRITTALDTISAVAGGFILNTIEPLVGGIATFLEKMTTTPEKTVLDDFNAIEVDTSQKMADLEATYNKAQDIIKLLDDISKQTVTLKDGSTMTFEELFKDLGNVEKNGGDVRGYLENLGVDVDEVIQKYNVWKESTKQLTSVVPALSSVIDSETGAIEGGTEALQKNLDEWKAYQEKKIAWAAYYAKERALAEKKGEMYMYEFDAGAARQAAKRVQDNLEKQAISLGINLDWYEGDYSKSKIAGQTNVLTEEQRTYNETLAEYLELENKASAAEAELAVAQAQVEIAKQEVEVARLEKEAALEAQKAYTENYFRDKELDVQKAAVEAINPSVKTIITSGDGEGFSGLVGVKEVLDSIGK